MRTRAIVFLLSAVILFPHVIFAGEKVKLALNWKAEPEFGGFYTAQVEKLYQKHALDVEVLQGGAGTPTVQMVAAGQVDFGIVSGDEIILARGNGADVVGVFAVFQTAPYAIMLREESGIQNFEELFKSKMTLAVVKGLPYVNFIEKKYGFNNLKIVPYQGGITNFLSEKNYAQQCFVSSEPLLAAQKGIKTKTLLVADTGFNPYTVVLAVKGETLKKKPDLVKRMVQAAREGWQAYLKSPKSTHEFIAGLNPTMSVGGMAEIQKIEARLIENDDTKKNGLGHMTEERWTNLIKQLKDLKMTKKDVVAKDVFVNF